MKKILCLMMLLIIGVMSVGCSKSQEDFNGAIKPSANEKGGMIEREEALKIAEAHPELKALGDVKLKLEEVIEATEEQPIWELHYREEKSQLTYALIINAFTGEVLSMHVEDDHETDEEVLKDEMLRHVQWTFEHWQSFQYDNYEPSRYGLAFSLNFRIPYLFDNYEENKAFVLENKIISDVKIKEIKDVAMVFREEDETMYSQMRVIADYRQEVQGKEINESVEVSIFAKNALHGDEGWQITNVDMYPMSQETTGFEQLFFGFRKNS
ncbi:hypothetical protein HNQ80_003842 [Anaerosolibacter carboniphilus]|uniref:PepSY domain-containing protein n=1 Tax=Anaerosolibacter carboniphilus TaxID=1417629 RepID=A0A841L5M7_9FIRM|nr:PepSY domain-containing protein [Anaerosolibacter carboniphilus]MBB6217719.1 hypothetical protein [Anaerosolibacter carboniphilus]